ncbi:hypothetical protein [Arthrobacter sp. C152]
MLTPSPQPHRRPDNRHPDDRFSDKQQPDKRQPGGRPPGSVAAGHPGVDGPEAGALGRAAAGDGGVLKAMSPGVVDYLFRQLVAGHPAADVQWESEGTTLDAQPEGAELARRLSETDLDALTPVELFHYVRAAQRLVTWAEDLRQAAVGRYCNAGTDAPRPGSQTI